LLAIDQPPLTPSTRRPLSGHHPHADAPPNRSGRGWVRTMMPTYVFFLLTIAFGMPFEGRAGLPNQ
jgi:hypothetical protein